MHLAMLRISSRSFADKVVRQFAGNNKPALSPKFRRKPKNFTDKPSKSTAPPVLCTVPILPSSAPYSALLSLVQKEPVSLNTSRLIENFPSVTNDARFLSSLRHCHRFDEGREFLRSRLGSLSPAAVLEGARLLVDGVVGRQTGEDDRELAEKMMLRFKSQKLPPSLAQTTELLLSAVLDPEKAFSLCSQPDSLLNKKETLLSFACISLKMGQWEQFKRICGFQDPDIIQSPYVSFWLLHSIANGKIPAREATKWCLESLVDRGIPLQGHDFHNLFFRLFQACKIVPERVQVDQKTGAIRGKDIALPVDLPIAGDELAFLKADFQAWAKGLTSQAGSLTKTEVSRMKQAVVDWKASAQPDRHSAVVVDTLNVTHRQDILIPMMQRLAEEFGNIMLVTRKFQVPRLQSVKWQGNVHIFSCDTLSEDDLITLMAAVEWGPLGFVLSNDRFGAHIIRLKCTGSLSLEKWIEKRVIRYERNSPNYLKPTYFAQNVLRVGGGGLYFLPVHYETADTPTLEYWLVSL